MTAKHPSSRPDRPVPAPGELQGEGNYDAARRFRKAEEKFVGSGRVDEAAREAAPRSKDEARQMEDAEREGRSHAKR